MPEFHPEGYRILQWQTRATPLDLVLFGGDFVFSEDKRCHNQRKQVLNLLFEPLFDRYQLIRFSLIRPHHSCQILNPLQENKCATISCLQLSMCCKATKSCNPHKCSGGGPFFKTETVTAAPGGAISKEIVITGIN